MAGSGRKKNGILMILLSLFIILAVVAVAFFYRDRLFPAAGQTTGLETPSPDVTMVKIVVLAQPVSRGATIVSDVLATVSYPQAELVEGLFITNQDEVIGKTAKFDLPQGMPLTPGYLSDTSVGSLAAVQIPKNMVAISIPITRLSSVAYALQPGDHVNVLGSMLMIDVDPAFQSRLPNKAGEVSVSSIGAATEGGTVTSSLTVRVDSPLRALALTDPNPAWAANVEGTTLGRVELDQSLNQPIYVLPSELQRPRLISQTIVQNATVLWVGEFPAENAGATQLTPTPTPVPAEGQEAAAPVPVRPDIISLIVSPQDAVTLNYFLLSKANLNLVMRGTGDVEQNTTEAVTLQYILDQYRMPYPAKLPYATEPRIDLLPPTQP